MPGYRIVCCDDRGAAWAEDIWGGCGRAIAGLAGMPIFKFTAKKNSKTGRYLICRDEELEESYADGGAVEEEKGRTGDGHGGGGGNNWHANLQLHRKKLAGG